MVQRWTNTVPISVLQVLNVGCGWESVDACYRCDAAAAAAAAKSLQSCPTLCDPTEGSPPGSPVPGILQARALGWVAMSFSNDSDDAIRMQMIQREHREEFTTFPWKRRKEG